MKRRIIVLSVLLFSLLALVTPNSANTSHTATCDYSSGCDEYCYFRADLCYQACDQGSLGGRAVCYNNCMWEQEYCLAGC